MSERPDGEKTDKKPEPPLKTGEKKPEPEKPKPGDKPVDSGSGGSGVDTGPISDPPGGWKVMKPEKPPVIPANWQQKWNDPTGTTYYHPDNPEYEFDSETGIYTWPDGEGNKHVSSEPPEVIGPKDPLNYQPPKN